MRNEKDKVMLSEPPRLLLGITFLFWGAMHDRPVVSLLAALLVEGRHWIKLRWEFGEKGFARSWHLSAVILIFSAIGLLQKDVLRPGDFLDLLSWLPLVMMPLLLAQQYGGAKGVPMVTFSFIARRKLIADRKAGRRVDQTAIQLGYPFLLLILVAAGMGVGTLKALGPVQVRYALGVALLLGVCLLKLRGKKARPAAWGMAYGSSMILAALTSWALYAAYQYYLKAYTQGGSQQASALQARTSIGEVRELQLSHRIYWRYLHEKGEKPDLLTQGVYNEPLGNVWLARSNRTMEKERIPSGREVVGGDFEMFLGAGENEFIFHEKDRGHTDYQVEGRIIGLVSEGSLIPHGAKTKRYEGLKVDILAANSFGSVQMMELNQGAVDARMRADSGLEAIEHDPSDLDLSYPKKEEEGLTKFLAEIGCEVTASGGHPERTLANRVKPGSIPPDFSEEEVRDFVARLEFEFIRRFHYTLLLTGENREAPISGFLNETRKGHCEYFAGATAMLLRRMGIPCRYVVGFAVQEKGDDGEWILRGQHAHAWAQAYVGGKWVLEEGGWRCRGGEWVDVDLTPPDWLSQGTSRPWYQFLSDWFQRARAASVLWLANPGIFEGFQMVLIILVPIFLIYLVYQLIKTRGRKESSAWDEAVGKEGHLRDLERWLARRVGPRPRSVPLAKWLRQHLPASAGGLVEAYEAVTFRGDEMVDGEFKVRVKEAKAAWKSQKTPGPRGARGS